MNLPFVSVRKAGKSPPPVYQVEYDLEYGTDTLEIEEVLVKEGMNIALVDDLIATGGTARAATELLEKAGAKVPHFAFIVELSDLPWEEKIPKGVEVFVVTDFPKTLV